MTTTAPRYTYHASINLPVSPGTFVIELKGLTISLLDHISLLGKWYRGEHDTHTVVTMLVGAKASGEDKYLLTAHLVALFPMLTSLFQSLDTALGVPINVIKGIHQVYIPPGLGIPRSTLINVELDVPIH